MASEELVKENRVKPLPLTWPWLCAGLAVSACAVLATLTIDYALPEPLTRDTGYPEQFIAQIAYEHLVNLTAIGPRVAGSYENEVVSVGVLVSAIKSIAAQASVHNHVELDVQRASGSFALTFMDGMNNVYRDVQSVVARVRGAGGRERPRTAILLNCHFDTVPDSPGASDDGAGCAVMLDVLRALAATRRPLRHDAIFLFNGAEENILQASHAFITQHKWSKSVRAFINIEACGAGGREVMFQAGPHDPWIVEVYAGAVPHPFASSLAQELFQSGAIPADTDFRIFRDFGKLSGVDLAWSANGYVYHTRLDTAERVPPAALQRTGDNVLALARGLLASDSVRSEVDPASRQPAFFDVLGVAVLSARAPAALALSAATLALLLLKIHLNARDARRRLYLSYGAWWRQVGAAMAVTAAASAGGAAAAASVAALLHALGARLAFYSRPLLLVPLYVAPGEAGGELGAGGRAVGGARRLGGAARRLGRSRAARRGRGAEWRGAAGVRGARAALGVPAAAVDAAAVGCGRAGRRAAAAARRAVGAGRGAAAAADVVPAAQHAAHVRAHHGPRGRRGPATGRGDGAADGGAFAGGVELAAALRGGHEEQAHAGVRAGGHVRAERGAGRQRRARRALQRRAPAAPHAVPHAPHAARAPGPRPRRPRHPRPLLLGARAGRQHALHARRARGPGGGGGRRGVCAARVLRRALLPARAGPRESLAPRARDRRAARAPRRARARGAARRGRARAAGERDARAAARRVGGGAGARRAPAALQRAGGAAGGRALGRAPHILLRAARGARAGRVARGAAAGGRRRGAGGRVAGGPRAVRRRQAAGRARARAGRAAAARGRHGLGRRPAPLRAVTYISDE